MTVKELFKKIDTANEIRKLIGEEVLYSISIIDNEPITTVIATVNTYSEYKKAIHEYYIPIVEEELKNADLIQHEEKGIFKVNNEELNIILCIEKEY